MLKVAWGGDDESLHEDAALPLWGGDGAVRVLRHDRSRRALLEERAVPGNDISGVPDEQAAAIPVDVAPRLWRPAQASHSAGSATSCPAGSTEVSATAERAVAACRSPASCWWSFDPGDERLVHGDFHHHNILRHGSRYVAIDPKPYLADPEYDLPSWLWNPLSYRMADRDKTERRIAASSPRGSTSGASASGRSCAAPT